MKMNIITLVNNVCDKLNEHVAELLEDQHSNHKLQVQISPQPISEGGDLDYISLRRQSQHTAP